MNQRAEREQLERLANEVRVYKQENLMLKVIGDDIDDDNHGHEDSYGYDRGSGMTREKFLLCCDQEDAEGLLSS